VVVFVVCGFEVGFLFGLCVFFFFLIAVSTIRVFMNHEKEINKFLT